MVEEKEKNSDSVEDALTQLAHLSLSVTACECTSDIRSKPISPLEKPRKLSEKLKQQIRKPIFLIRPATFNFQHPSRRSRYKYRPYILVRRKSNPVADINTQSCEISAVAKLSAIKLPDIEDVDELKLNLLLSPTNSNRCMDSCSVQASRGTSTDEGVSGEVSELAEYFSKFVAMQLKMSPLAESMYV